MSTPIMSIYSSSSGELSKGYKRDNSNEERGHSATESFTYASAEISVGHASESNEEQEQKDFITEEKETSSINRLLELVFSGNKYFRLGVEGPLPSPTTVDLSQSLLGSFSQPFETLPRPSRESVVVDTQESIDLSFINTEAEILEDGHPKDPLSHDVIYPDIELVSRLPFLLDYYKSWPDEENEDWATSGAKIREEIKGTLSFLHLKKGLSKFSYEIYGFTTLKLSGKSLADISLFARLPMTFSALTHIDLSHNKLVDISALSGLTTITHLDVSHNKLKKLLFMYPEWYWNVDEPGHLDIEGNVSRSITQLSSSGWVLCGNGISQLRWVNYSHNLVRNLEGPKHWAHYPFLSYLNLSYNHISDLRSEDRILISNGTPANPEGGASIGSTIQCGLSCLNLLHTLDISNNFISRVEGLNGLCVHNLILSNNSISSWEGEAGQLYEDERYTNVCDYLKTNVAPKERPTLDSQVIISNELREESMIKSVYVNAELDDGCSLAKDDVAISQELCELSIASDNLPTPNIRVMRNRIVERDCMREENGEGDASKYPISATEEYPSPKTVEVLFTEADRKKEKIPIEIIYKSKRPLSSVEHHSEDVSVMDASYLEKKEEGDYTTWRRRLEVMYFSENLRSSEEDPSNVGSDSVHSLRIPAGSCRKSYDSTPKINCASGGGGEQVPPDSLSISKMFDYEWEGYEPDDPCFAKGQRGKAAPEKRRSTKESSSAGPNVEVLYERESAQGEGGSAEEDGDRDEEASTRLYEEWDDPEVHVLYASGLELDSDYDSGSVEESSGRAGSTESVRVLYQAGGPKGAGLVREILGYPGEDADDGLEVLFRRTEGRPDSDESQVPGSKSVEVLFHREGELRESCIEFDQVGDEVCSEEGGERATVDWSLEVFFEVYEQDDSKGSEVGEVLSDVETSESSSTTTIVAGSESSDIPKKMQVDILKRVNANRFEECGGIRSLKWLTELHLECNRLTSLKMLRGTYWLRSLFLRDNLIAEIGEIMLLSELHQLSTLDLTGNPVCDVEDFHQTTLFIVPSLLYLNQVRSSDLETKRPPEIIFYKNPFFRAARIVQDLLIASELKRENHVPWSCPELDALPYMYSPYPVLLLVGPEGSGNKELCQSLFERLPQKVCMSNLITTKPSPIFRRYVSTPPSNGKENVDSRKSVEDPDSAFRIYRSVTEDDFLEILFAGSFASVSEDGGFLFGFEKCEALRAAREDRVLVAAVDLTTALVLYLSEYCGKPRLVLVLPESVSIHEKNLRRESRNDRFSEEEKSHGLVPQVLTEGGSSKSNDSSSGCEVGDGSILRGSLLAEQEFVQRNLEARQECLTTHHNNPEIFHSGVFCDDKESALGKVIDMVEEMCRERKDLNMHKNKWYKLPWYEESLSKDIDDRINVRLKKELLGCVSMWE